MTIAVAESQETFTAGTILTFSNTFTTVIGGAPVDPGEVTFAYRIENASPVYFYYEVTLDIVRDSTGVYHIDLDTTGFAGVGQVVLMTAIFAGTSPGQASDEMTVAIKGSSIPLLFQ